MTAHLEVTGDVEEEMPTATIYSGAASHFFALRVDVPASLAYVRKLRPREERSREQASPLLWWGWDSEPKEGGSGTEVPCPPRGADPSRDGGWSIWGWA